MARATSNDFVTYWHRKMDQVLRLIQEAYERESSTILDVGDLRDISRRQERNWPGSIRLSLDEMTEGSRTYRTYLQHLGRLLIKAQALQQYGDASFEIMVDRDLNLQVRRLSDLVKEHRPDALAYPFSQIFTNRDEAEWTFDFLYKTLTGLGVSDSDNPMFACTLRYNNQTLRLNYGNWAFLQFYAPGYKEYRCGISLIDDLAPKIGEYATWGPFNTDDPSTVVRVYEMPLERVRYMDEALERAYESTLTYTAKRFGHWARSNLRPHNIPEIAQAVFDTSFREQLLSNGIKAPIESEGRFSEATFDLLEDLHRRPRLDFYMEHREDFEEHLIKPFKHLFTAVAEELPARMKATLETESRLFSRIPKNDFGQGGAWDHYWAAFYPKGGKRTSDVQLALWINYQMLKVGFSFGAYSSEGKKRFLKHCEEHREALVALLQESFDGVRWVFGASEQIELKDGEAHGISMTWKEWLSDPEPANASLGVVLPRQQAVGARFEELRDLTLNTYERLFPLVLLATEDDPIPAIIDYLESDTEAIELDETNPIYPLAECAEETGFNETDLARWVRAIERKGQAIFYGPPGTGKTFIAEHLAKHIVGGGDGIVELVQFHPAYAYEDFIQGIRPQARADGTLSYDVVSGRFLDFCERASTRKGRSVLIIDEINRANLSRVFGELMYLLEYRRKKVPLAGGGTLSIPQNVRIIGTMNTADRSIALVDHALRRRFAFLALAPNYEVLRRYHRDHETGFPVQRLIGVLRELNVRIGDPHYYVGITFFLHEDLADAIEDIWEMEIVPYLEEYFFDQADQVQAFRWSQIASRITGNA